MEKGINMTTINDESFPFNLDDLVNKRSIEGSRIEYKETWDDNIKENFLKTICAFANDFLNLNGGYIILGIKDNNGSPVLPPKGLNRYHIERIQQEIRIMCKQHMKPDYLPAIFIHEYMKKTIMIIMCNGGPTRPYEARDKLGGKYSSYLFFIRIGPETIKADGENKKKLLEMTATIPFDDRINQEYSIDEIDFSIVKQFLRNVGSGIPLDNGLEPSDIYKKLGIVQKVNSHYVPKNIGLMFFSDNPDRYFKGARIEVVQFTNEAGDLLEEKIFKGPINQQVRNVLDFLNSLGGSLLEKVRGRAEVERTVPYPYEAMEEAIVNAVYHRGYNRITEPTKVYLYPDRMEIISYPGPVPGINLSHFDLGSSVPPVPARNRRVGEFLKELKLAEGRGTGIPKIRTRMRENGSPEPKFDFDEGNSYFRVTLPVHPRYQILTTIREADMKWVTGEREYAITKLKRAYEKVPTSGALASKIIDYASDLGDSSLAEEIYLNFKGQELRSEASRPFLSYAKHLIRNRRNKEANQILESIPSFGEKEDKLEIAMMKRKSGALKDAHIIFMELFSEYPDDPKIVHELAQIKNKIARTNRNFAIKKRLTKEAVELLRRAIALSDNDVRSAWCWFDLAKSLNWLREPSADVEKAYLKAISLLPDEKRFQSDYDRWKTNTN